MQTNPPSLLSVTLTYTGFFVAMSVLINVIVWAADRFAGFQIEANAIGWLPLILAAMMAGNAYGNKAGHKPPQAFSWAAGLIFLVISLILSLAGLYVLAIAMGIDVDPGAMLTQMRAEIGGDGGLIAAIIGGLLLFIWVAQRFSFSMGAGQAIKQAALRAK